jgi:hypothetical protein
LQYALGKRDVNFDIPSGVTVVYSSAFSGCDALVYVTLPTSLTEIYTKAFYDCYNLYVVRNKSDRVFNIGNPTNGEGISTTVKIIYNNSSTTYADDGYEYLLDDNGFLFRIKDGSYTLIAYCNNKKTVTLPESVNGLEYDIDEMRGVKNVIIPMEVYKLDENSFAGCTTLLSVVMHPYMGIISEGAFANCTSLTAIYCTGTQEAWDNNVVNNEHCIVPDVSVYFYSETEPTEDGNFWYYDENNNITVW